MQIFHYVRDDSASNVGVMAFCIRLEPLPVAKDEPSQRFISE
jgi:hypothetical protein